VWKISQKPYQAVLPGLGKISHLWDILTTFGFLGKKFKFFPKSIII